jgi:hypothetical protein
MDRILSFLFLSAICVLSCTKKIYLKKIDSYLNASSVVVKSKYMADDYHSFFMERKAKVRGKPPLYNHFKIGMAR